MRYSTRLHLSATDLSNHIACPHLTELNVAAAMKRLVRPFWEDPALQALIQRGEEHEVGYVNHLRKQGLAVVEIPRDDPTDDAAQTMEAMRGGADVIVQATLQSDRRGGRADVLRRVAVPSSLGDWSYEVLDTKLARETRGGTILQLCFYSDLVREIQGRLPESMYVVTPGTDYVPETYRVLDYLAFYRRVCAQLEAAVADIEAEPSIYPEPCQHCDICDWRRRCVDRRRDDDHLCLVAGISRLQTRELQEREIDTLEKLATTPLPLPFKPARGARESYERIREQARIQLDGRREGKPLYELLPFEEGFGLARLPEPSEGDVFFDFEGDPFVGTQGREYLFGYVTMEDGEPRYHALWALSEVEEKRAFETFIADMMARFERHPGFHIYHYAPYEPAALKRLMGRYAVCEDEVDRLLRGERFVDLYAVVRRGLRASVENYSIKNLEVFYKFERSVDLDDANLHRHALERALELADSASITGQVRETVEEYNRDDCLSTLRLREWLEQLRGEEIERGMTIPRPEPKTGEASESLTEEQVRIRELMSRLLRDVPVTIEGRSPDEHARWILAQMLEYHRREDKAVWWEYYRLRDLNNEEMLDEPDAIAGMTLMGRLGTVKRSVVDRYGYPPQETRIRLGDDVKTSVVDAGGYGSVEAIDPVARTIDIKKGPRNAEMHARAIFKHDAVPAGVLRQSLGRLGEWVAANGVDASGPFRAARDLLSRRPPRFRKALSGPLQHESESALDAARRLVVELDQSVLPIQGPPGTGKTYAGARMICELVRARKKVGITAVSHRVVRNFLEEIFRAAVEEGVSVRCIQKVKEDPEAWNPAVRETKDNADVLDALNQGQAQVAAGTAWLWARDDMIESVDVLFIDEAGQMKLANALAASSGARSLVLLGDPQQLEQPQQGSHPEGTDVSALEHLLGGRQTMPRDRGLFLGETWRLHPSICQYTSELFYENRLRSRRGLEKQRIIGNGPIDGAGLWFVPVEHTGNQNSSMEEVEQVADLVETLTNGDVFFETAEGQRSALELGHILIVAPYNAQVAAISERLPGARVGTVDRFQGQEAPIVIYSMATSSPEDAPRGMEFLYSLSRLNVATSRARCACILVASPHLMEPECRTPRQMKLANAFCRYPEMAISGA